jgi:hypothetical protein
MGQGHRGGDAIAGRRWDATAEARRSDPFEKHARESNQPASWGRDTHLYSMMCGSGLWMA